MTKRTPAETSDFEDALRGYKSQLSAILEQRPSGTRLRLAEALDKQRSFITQMCSPTYSVPIPGRHLPVIFSVCHFNPQQRAQFLAAYRRAHPGRLPPGIDVKKVRHISLSVPDLGDDKQNAALDRAVIEFVHRIIGVVGIRKALRRSIEPPH